MKDVITEKVQNVSVVVPVYNEAKTLAILVERIHLAFEKEKLEYEVIIVDDRSTDKTEDVINEISKKYHVKYQKKQGKKGKAYSILEGAEKASFEHIVMIDADLQYAPEYIPEMAKGLKDHGVVVAERKTYKGSKLRRFSSRANAFIFGRVLLDLPYDIQSGLKAFRKEILTHIDKNHVSAWSFDIPLLHTTRELGFTIGTVDITFELRKNGASKINFLETALQIAHSAIKVKNAKRKVYRLPPNNKDSMIGAGIAHKRKRFITHTTLHNDKSAITTLLTWQKVGIIVLVALLAFGLYKNTLTTAIAFVGILSTIYFLDVLFNLYVVLKSLHFPPEIKFSDEEIKKIKNEDLPLYTILCPLYNEAHIVGQFVRAIARLDWPKNKLDVMLLLEEDDKDTIEKIKAMDLPDHIRIVVVPDSEPKTKPKACNYGLSKAKGEYIVIFDAEDVPDPFQLKKAYLGFQKLPDDIACLQAKLNFYNPHHNLLTRMFTAEYSLWFDVVLTGLQSAETSLPLGGTSNHFRTAVLRKLTGWDPFNVTEDADLGARLFKEGGKTAVIDSTTMEEANSDGKNWIRQRSRWIKGYIQTYFVHMRNPISFMKNHGIHALIFQLVVGGKIAFMLINPFLWIATVSYFTLYAIVGPTIETLYPTVIFYMAVISLVFGNFLCIYYYMIGCAKRNHWSLIKYIYLVPFYWLMVSIAAVMAVIQLIIKPHYWEKTNHGLHIGKEKILAEWEEQVTEVVSGMPAYIPQPENRKWLRNISFSELGGGGILIITSVVANFFNFLYNAYLGRVVSVEEFGLVTLIGSFLYLSQVPLGSLAKTVTYRTAYLLGQYKTPVKEFWIAVRKNAIKFALIVSGIWLLAAPIIAEFFNTGSLTPILIFTPVWFIGTLWAVDSAFLSGSMRFGVLALIVSTEAISKFVFSYLFVQVGLSEYVYASVPLSMGISLMLGWTAVQRSKTVKVNLDLKTAYHFPKKFYLASIFTLLSTATFLTIDVLLAKHFLGPVQAGQYALLSLVGKMIFFIGNLFTQFTVPFVSRAEGAGKKSHSLFYTILTATTLAAVSGFVIVGLFGHITVPILLGEKTQVILPYLPRYSLAMVYFTVAMAIVIYHQVKRQYVFPTLALLISAVQVIGVMFYHEGIDQIVTVVLSVSVLSVSLVSLTHVFYSQLAIIGRNVLDLLGLFKEIKSKDPNKNGHLNILIFNWRDTKHVWAGGAEVYIQELAKRWVEKGHHVTLFCGNDARHARNQVVDGVQIVRRGGFYTVYVWALLYYILKFRGLFDVVIDSENGIPFFTPWYVGVPKFLLIHHVHQKVFREHLSFPFAQIALFIESKLMPMAYKNCRILTVSESSKKEIIELGITETEEIYVISPGIDPSWFTKAKKTANPSVLYLGRLKPYKNIDLAIKAFATVLKTAKSAQFIIAGEGESATSLANLVLKLGIQDNVTFKGRVTSEEKRMLLAQSWALLQPSSIEGWGITVIEANISGTPVVAANVPGLKDSVVNKKTGVLVPPESVAAFAQAVTDLIENTKSRQKMSEEAYEWAKTFDWDKSAEKFIEILKREITMNSKLQIKTQFAVQK